MKKFAWLLALAVTFGVVGCGGGEKDKKDKKEGEKTEKKEGEKKE